MVARLAVLLALGLAVLAEAQPAPFVLPTLPYAYAATELAIDGDRTADPTARSAACVQDS